MVRFRKLRGGNKHHLLMVKWLNNSDVRAWYGHDDFPSPPNSNDVRIKYKSKILNANTSNPHIILINDTSVTEISAKILITLSFDESNILRCKNAQRLKVARLLGFRAKQKPSADEIPFINRWYQLWRSWSVSFSILAPCQQRVQASGNFTRPHRVSSVPIGRIIINTADKLLYNRRLLLP